jgi:hypothetical protein
VVFALRGSRVVHSTEAIEDDSESENLEKGTD